MWKLFLFLLIAMAHHAAPASTLATLMTDPPRNGRAIHALLCATLRESGLDKILPGDEPSVRMNFEAPIPGIPCELSNQSGQVFILAVVTDAARARHYFEEERAKARAAGASKFMDEPRVAAFGWRDGHWPGYMALVDGVIVALQFHIHGADEAQLFTFARRVVARLREPRKTSNGDSGPSAARR
jgi:hypothetical protein